MTSMVIAEVPIAAQTGTAKAIIITNMIIGR
jgi:hypothetical protein